MSSRILLATVAAIALGVPAIAQDQAQPLQTEQEATEQLGRTQHTLPEQSGDRGDTAGQPEQAAEPAQPPLTAEEQPPPADMQFIQVQDEAQFLADEEVIGKDVINVMDEQVGTIADLVMDQEQKLVGVVLSVGGFLGIGEKWVAIPVEQIEFPTGDQPARLVVAVTEEQLKNAPDFMTRQEVQAEEEAAQAEQQAMDQPPQLPAPAPATQ